MVHGVAVFRFRWTFLHVYLVHSRTHTLVEARQLSDSCIVLFHLASRPSCFFESGSNGRTFARDLTRRRVKSFEKEIIMRFHLDRRSILLIALALQAVSSNPDEPVPSIFEGIGNVANSATNFREFSFFF